MDYIPKKRRGRRVRGMVNKRGAKTIKTRNKKKGGGRLRVIVQPTLVLNGLVMVKGKLWSRHHRERAAGAYFPGEPIFNQRRGGKRGLGEGG